MEVSMGPQGMQGGGPVHLGRNSSLGRESCMNKDSHVSGRVWSVQEIVRGRGALGDRVRKGECPLQGWLGDICCSRGPGCMRILSPRKMHLYTNLSKKFRFFEAWPCPLRLSRHLFRGENPPMEHRRHRAAMRPHGRHCTSHREKCPLEPYRVTRPQSHQRQLDYEEEWPS